MKDGIAKFLVTQEQYDMSINEECEGSNYGMVRDEHRSYLNAFCIPVEEHTQKAFDH